MEFWHFHCLLAIQLFNIKDRAMLKIPVVLFVITAVAIVINSCDDGRNVLSPERAEPEFLLNEVYSVEDTMEVKLRNNSPDTIIHSTFYAACNLHYFDSKNREFVIPPGTHCDLANRSELFPGQTITLFKWDLSECTKDNWGCVEKSPLPRGQYRIAGVFKNKDNSKEYEVSAVFEIN